MAAETPRERLQGLYQQLDSERSSWVNHWRELADFVRPRRLRLQVTDHNRGHKVNQRIVDGTATYAVRTLRSGMMAGLTSPARPWMRLTLPDPDLAEFGPVKRWLHTVTSRMLTVFARSNVYSALPIAYGDEGLFGTSALAVLDDAEDVIRCLTFPIGSYWLAVNDRLQVDVFVRQASMTVRQVVEAFARIRERSGSPDWSTISPAVKDLWEASRYETPVTVMHAVLPNELHDPGRLDARFKRYRSVYWEAASDHRERFLRESGFDTFPVLATRWEVTGEDAYGSSPGMDALGDVKQLQSQEKRAAHAIEKTVNPPMQGPPSLKNQKASILPGDVTLVDERQGGPGFRPAHEVRFPVGDVESKSEQIRQRIRHAFYVDLFLMLAMSDRRQITAREIEERHEEKLLMLGPVLEQQNDEKLDPLVDRTFDAMQAGGLIPEPPAEIAGMDLKVEYVSILAQAQKAVATAGLERTVGFTRSIAEATQDPAAWDKLDTDQAIDEYGEMQGVSPHVLRTDEQVAARRARRAALQAEAARVAALEPMARSAKAFAEAAATTAASEAA